MARNYSEYGGLWLIGACGAASCGAGLWMSNWAPLTSGTTGLIYVAALLAGRRSFGRTRGGSVPASRSHATTDFEPAPCTRTATGGDTSALVDEMLSQGRYSLLLRPQIIGNLSDAQRTRAQSELEQEMSLVPQGEVVLGAIDDVLDDGKLSDDEIVQRRATVLRVDGFFLDRYAVTNRQYYRFVAGGGYEQMAIWDPEVWPAVIDFVDESGCPGPRFWRDGVFPPGEADHPVVGVSWYEATAYARWIGKRLATDGEWVKAGSWPVVLSETARLQRRYPWGNSMESDRANLWGTGPGHIVPVTEFAEGASVGGIYGLIGNVWEWTADALTGEDGHGPSHLCLSIPMKTLRGGAFDTYFENHATCQFPSGDIPLARKHNVGFRCAIGLCDLADPMPYHELDRGEDKPVLAHEHEEAVAAV